MEQPQPQNISRAESSTTLQKGYQEGADPGLIAHQLNPDPVLMPLKFNWLGYSVSGKDKVGNDIYQKTHNAIMTEEAANIIINEVRTRFNHFACLSNLTEEQIYMFKEECEHTINELLFNEEESWKIHQYHKDMIINSVGQQVMIGLMRAKNQGERVFLSKTLETKQVFQEKEQKKRGLLGRVLPKI